MVWELEVMDSFTIKSKNFSLRYLMQDTGFGSHSQALLGKGLFETLF